MQEGCLWQDCAGTSSYLGPIWPHECSQVHHVLGETWMKQRIPASPWVAIRQRACTPPILRRVRHPKPQCATESSWPTPRVPEFWTRERLSAWCAQGAPCLRQARTLRSRLRQSWSHPQGPISPRRWRSYSGDRPPTRCSPGSWSHRQTCRSAPSLLQPEQWLQWPISTNSITHRSHKSSLNIKRTAINLTIKIHYSAN